MTTQEQGPQCPPVSPALVFKWTDSALTTLKRYQLAAQWGFTQGLAAAQRLAAEERQRGADEELEACVAWVRDYLHQPNTANALREDRRPPAPTVREQALQRMAELRDRGSHTWQDVLEAFDLAAQALEAGDER